MSQCRGRGETEGGEGQGKARVTIRADVQGKGQGVSCKVAKMETRAKLIHVSFRCR